jgi:ketosteroid isomerase-like protein
MNAPEHASAYEIRVLGTLDARWSTWFADLDVSCNAVGETILSGPIRDQAALHGVLARVRDLGLPLIAVHRLEGSPSCAGPSVADRYPSERTAERTSWMSHHQIPDLVRRWAEAESRSDPDTLDTLMTDDCTLVGPAGFVLDRQQCLDRYRTGGLKTTAFAWSDVMVREYGSTRVILGIVTQTASHQGRDASGRFRAIQIAVLQDGHWKCAGLQFSGPIPAMPPRQG